MVKENTGDTLMSWEKVCSDAESLGRWPTGKSAQLCGLRLEEQSYQWALFGDVIFSAASCPRDPHPGTLLRVVPGPLFKQKPLGCSLVGERLKKWWTCLLIAVRLWVRTKTSVLLSSL